MKLPYKLMILMALAGVAFVAMSLDMHILKQACLWLFGAIFAVCLFILSLIEPEN